MLKSGTFFVSGKIDIIFIDSNIRPARSILHLIPPLIKMSLISTGLLKLGEILGEK